MKTPDSRPTIVFFDHTAHWSGGEISLFNLVTRLNRSKYRLLVVLFDDGPLREKLDAAGIETRVLPLAEGVSGARKDDLGVKSLLKWSQIAAMGRFIRRLRRLLREERAAIVHCNSLKADLVGGIAARLARVPAIWHVRDSITSDYLPSPVARAFRGAARVIPTQIIAVSGATLAALRLPPSKRAVAIHNGTVLENFDFEAAPTPFSRADGAFVVGIVGRLAHWKGQHIFLDAAAQVSAKFPTARFQIVGAALFGEDEYEAKIRAQCRDLGLENVVDWLGFRADVPAVIAQMDVLAHASISPEPFGQVIIEGMAAGKPVVATNGGGVPEIVQNGETGWLVPMGDAEALAQAIIRLFENREQARAMGKAGRERVETHFSIQATTRHVEAVYESMLLERKKK
jgi:glycosyltransferase involved in cell wall biosynthesis